MVRNGSKKRLENQLEKKQSEVPGYVRMTHHYLKQEDVPSSVLTVPFLQQKSKAADQAPGEFGQGYVSLTAHGWQ